GDAQRSGVVDLPDEPLDVVATYDLLEEGWEFYNGVEPGLVHTPYGLVGMRWNPGPEVPITGTAGVGVECVLFRVLDPYRGTTEVLGEPSPCGGGGRITGYSVNEDLLVGCIDGLPQGGADLLFAFEASTGEYRWGAGPELPQAEPPGAGDQNDWFCEAAAIDDARGLVFVGYASDYGRNRVEAVALADGTRMWSRGLGVHDFTGSPLDLPTQASIVDSDTQITGITLTEDAVVVAGFARENAMTVSWLDFDGRLVGTWNSVFLDRIASDAFSGWGGGSLTTTASGHLAAGLFRPGLMIFDTTGPTVDRPILVDVVVDPVPTAVPAWSSTHLVLPTVTDLVILEATDTSDPRIWTTLDSGFVLSVVLDGSTDAYVQTNRPLADGTGRLDVFRVDLATGTTSQRIPFGIPEPSGQQNRLVPLPDGRGLVSFARLGATAVLAPAPSDRIPSATLDDAYPPAGEYVDVTMPPSGPATSYLVAWGDGVVEPAAPGETLAHAYADELRRTLRVTALYPGNLTGTQELAVHVGEPRPVELNFMQRAFAPDNQNATYGVLGLAATAIGGAIAVVSRSRRKTRLAAEIEALERIRARGRVDPHDAVHALAEYRRAMRAELAAGRLDDAQFSVLDHSASEVLQTLRQRILGPLAGRVSPAFAQKLDLALLDGTVDPVEAASLRSAISEEAALTADERSRLAGLFDSWATDATAPRG
ncbi:MAG TPA: hypothetical protein VI997_09310, partial [Candidatus Thermoplasmatota archaeon]|nr:hypothetical protein [Candidatus Thermoplasmatota archaeon]